ncbi:MAG TPA: asparagine synthase (glutamine-hydrolyzing) [Candidatus Paceibacterota bacterium]
MCGIGGFWGEGDAATLERMTAALSRRGPDDCGTHVEGRLGLAHTRLAIIDLSKGGHQPMTSATGHTTIVFNGEIYNFRELKKEIGNAHPFQSNSDTEVILALYETSGIQSFKRLNGMFAFALFDHRSQKLYLVRDRMGKKPLYWAIFDGTLIFGSELKALMQHEKFKKEIDPTAVRMYLTYECVPTPYSIFKGVKKVEAGGYLEFTPTEGAREHLYWRIRRDTSDISFEDAKEELDKRIEGAVDRRLISDVPLGIFLSGGIDSSTIAWYAQRASQAPIKTFSIGFTDKDFDESTYATAVAKRIGVEHTMEFFSAKRCIDLIPEVYAYLDEPIADASALPTYLLSAFTRKHVTVALGGDGADELFAGYPTFQAEKIFELYRRVPQALRARALEPFIQSLPVRHSYFSLDFRLKKFLEGVNAPPRYRHQHWLGAFSDEEAKSILKKEMIAESTGSPYEHLEQFFRDDADKGEFLNGVLWSYLRTYCMDQVLAKVDRMSMAHGLEVRAPFLDAEVVTFVQNLPYEYKFKGLTGKYILKKLMHGRLPASVLNRRKRGFAIPVGRWLQNELRPLMRETLSKERPAKSNFFESAVVERLMNEHERGVADHRKKLWTVLVFQLWYDTWAT